MKSRVVPIKVARLNRERRAARLGQSLLECRSSLSGPNLPMSVGQSMSALPSISDIDLFSYREGIIYLDAEVSDGAFDFGVAEQELHGP